MTDRSPVFRVCYEIGVWEVSVKLIFLNKKFCSHENPHSCQDKQFENSCAHDVSEEETVFDII